jgi:hypothetical protein
MRKLAAVLAVALSSTAAYALPPNSPYREGANHHVGDASFIAKFGRRPTARDSEAVRMHEHFAYVRALLAARPPTKPELAAQRAKILAAFDAYIAKGTTPENEHLPWRTPVFIDDHHTICAVGYLIEQTAGRELAEKIAARHRYDLLDDIAADMPEVRDWVAASGLTLEELASIQPAYTEPEANTWRTWDLAKHPHPDGAYDHGGVRGTFHKNRMEGTWTVTADGGTQQLGKGDFERGAGAWTSFYPTGEKLAEGRYADNRATGPWKLYFASGNLAAEGSFDGGDRAGPWRFYYDTPKKTPIATGSFTSGGYVTGTWRHYDATGALIAKSRIATPDLWGDTDWAVDGGEGSLLDLTAAADGIHHQIHQGTVGGVPQRLDSYWRGHERIYVQEAFGHVTTFDAEGHALVHGADGTWTASDCGWSKTRKDIARIGDIVRMHGLLYKDVRRRMHASRQDMVGWASGVTDDAGPTCKTPRAITGPRAHELDQLIADRDRTHAIPPSFVRAQVLGEDTANDSLTDEDKARVADMAEILAHNMSMYIECAFTQLFGTLPGRTTWHWYDGDPERGASE